MTIHVYSIMWNEVFLLPYFLRHYSLFADRIFIINDHSTDKTVSVARSHDKVTVLDYKYKSGLDEANFNQCFTRYYKKYSRGVADWAICVDADEFIYHPQLVQNLAYQRQRGIRIISTTAYTMIAKRLPRKAGQIYEECASGLRTRGYDKPIVFDPQLDVSFGAGRHSITATDGTRPHKGKLALLHFRYLSQGYFLQRTKNQLTKMAVSNAYKNYRLTKGLNFYRQALKSPLVKVI